MNCPAILLRVSAISTTNSMVVGFSFFFSITDPEKPTISFFSSSYGTKSAFATPHQGHLQFAGISENSVPGAIPLSSSPMSGS